jgi:hypothetical protein
MNRLILGFAAVGSAAFITSAVPASATPIAPIVPMSVEQDADGVTPVHLRGYNHRHCVFRYGERRCWSHGPVVRHYYGSPRVHFGFKYRDYDRKFRRYDDDRRFRGGDDGRRFRDFDGGGRRGGDGDRRRPGSGED